MRRFSGKTGVCNGQGGVVDHLLVFWGTSIEGIKSAERGPPVHPGFKSRARFTEALNPQMFAGGRSRHPW